LDELSSSSLSLPLDPNVSMKGRLKPTKSALSHSHPSNSTFPRSPLWRREEIERERKGRREERERKVKEDQRVLMHHELKV